MILEAITLILGYYILCVLGIYIYAVVKSWEITGVWRFDIKDGYVGICKYPRFTLYWIEWVLNKIRGVRK